MTLVGPPQCCTGLPGQADFLESAVHPASKTGHSAGSREKVGGVLPSTGAKNIKAVVPVPAISSTGSCFAFDFLPSFRLPSPRVELPAPTMLLARRFLQQVQRQFSPTLRRFPWKYELDTPRGMLAPKRSLIDIENFKREVKELMLAFVKEMIRGRRLEKLSSKGRRLSRTCSLDRYQTSFCIVLSGMVVEYPFTQMVDIKSGHEETFAHLAADPGSLPPQTVTATIHMDSGEFILIFPSNMDRDRFVTCMRVLRAQAREKDRTGTRLKVCSSTPRSS